VSSHRVLAAAAALREFGLAEISAFCDEQPPTIVDILAAAAPAVELVGEQRWRVADLAAVRREVRRGAPVAGRALPVPHECPDRDPDARLQLAEETLVACRAEPSAGRRRVMVATAVNHLRQVLAVTLPERSPWWSVELAPDLLDHELRHHPDRLVVVRLQLGIVVARLAEGNVTGNPVSADELIAAVTRFRDEPLLADRSLQGLVGGLVDLATAPDSAPTAPVDRLIIAVARRRSRVRAEHDLGAAMRALEPLMRSLGAGQVQPRVHDLFQTLRRLPDGRDHAVVYSDLLHVLPAQLRWHPTGEPLPGALVEVVAEPAVSVHLQHCARTLEADLVHSPFGSETALIGQAAHVFRELAEEQAGLDGTVVSRADVARSELLALAKAPVWPPAAAPPLHAAEYFGVRT
jgi:hypothetical protein